MSTTTTSLNKGNFSTIYIIKVGILSAIAFIVMFLEFPLPFFPAFLKFDFSDSIALIGGITLGPLAAVLIQLIKNLLNLLLHSSTGGIGELANFIVGIGLILPVTFAVKRKENNISLLIGLVIGTISMIIVAAFGNYFIFLPVYIPGIASADKISMILTTLTPFNAVKAVIEGILIIILFNGLKNVLKYLKSK